MANRVITDRIYMLGQKESRIQESEYRISSHPPAGGKNRKIGTIRGKNILDSDFWILTSEFYFLILTSVRQPADGFWLLDSIFWLLNSEIATSR